VYEPAVALRPLFTTNSIVAETHALLVNRLGYRAAEAGGVLIPATPRLEHVLRAWVSGMIDAVTDYDALALLPA
jgi:hypothetical protein